MFRIWHFSFFLFNFISSSYGKRNEEAGYFLARKLIFRDKGLAESLAKNKNTFPGIIQGSFVAFVAIIKFATNSPIHRIYRGRSKVDFEPIFIPNDSRHCFRLVLAKSPFHAIIEISVWIDRPRISFISRFRPEWPLGLKLSLLLSKSREDRSDSPSRKPSHSRIVLRMAMKSRFPSNEENRPSLSLSLCPFPPSLFFASCACASLQFFVSES